LIIGDNLHFMRELEKGISRLGHRTKLLIAYLILKFHLSQYLEHI